MQLILLVFGFVLVLVGAIIPPPTEPWRWRLCWIGVACVILAEILGRVGPLIR